MFVYGEPIDVPAGADRDLMEELRGALERSLVSLTERAEAIATGRDAGDRGVPKESPTGAGNVVYPPPQ